MRSDLRPLDGCGESTTQTSHATERDVTRALVKRYSRESNGGTPKWVYAAQVPTGTSFAVARPILPHEEADIAERLSWRGARGGTRILDFVAFNTWASGKGERHVHEIKVTRSDLRAELNDPENAQHPTRPIRAVTFETLERDQQGPTD